MAAPPPRKKLPKGVLLAIIALGCPLVLCIVLIIISIAGGFFAYFLTAEGEEEKALYQAYPEPFEPQGDDAVPVPAPLPAIPEVEEPVEEPVEPVEPPGKASPEGKLGVLDKGEINKVIKKNLSRFKYCYEKEHTSSSSLSRKVVIKFTIGRKGKVTKASIASSNLDNKKVEACIVNNVKKMKFPKPKGGVVVVSYPLIFTSAG